MEFASEYRFDGWTLRARTGELLKTGSCIRLQCQPLMILKELLDQPGEIVSREALIARLWPRGVVDYDTALNSAVRRLRAALGDRADPPRYIETIPKCGYRFIGRLELADAGSPPRPAVTTARVPPGRLRWRAAAAALLASAAFVMLSSFQPVPQRSGEGSKNAAASGYAEERYRLAQHFYHRRSPADLVIARRYFEDALALDPQHARAWAGLASTYWIDTMEGRLPDGLPKVREAAERALAIDPGLAEAHLRLAGYYGRTGDKALRQVHFRQAALAQPDHWLVLAFAAGDAAWEGRLDEAIELQRRAVEADPLMVPSRWNLATWLYLAGRFKEAEAEYRRVWELDPDNDEAAVRLADLLILEARYGEALELASRITRETNRLFAEALAYHGLGRQADADAALEALRTSVDEDAGLRYVEALAHVGQRDRAFDRLHALGGGDRNDPMILYSPFLRPLQADPRWEAWLMARTQPAPGGTS